MSLYYTGMLLGAKMNQVSSIPLGSNQVVSVKGTGANAISFDLSGGLLPSEKIPQIINIKNDGEEDVFVRAKAYVYTNDNGMVDLKLDTLDKWFYQDGYYYYGEKLKKAGLIGLANNLFLNGDYVFTNTKKYIANILIEALNANFSEEDYWGVEITNRAIWRFFNH